MTTATPDAADAHTDSPAPPLAVADFERTLAHVFARPERAARRFWEAVDTLGFEQARELLYDEPKSFGALRRDAHGDRDLMLANACSDASEAYLFRGLKRPPATRTGPLAAMREREAVARRRVHRILDRHFQQPDRALQALAAIARTDEPAGAAGALLSLPPELGPTRMMAPIVYSDEWRAVRAWARQRALIDNPGLVLDTDQQRFRHSLAERYEDPAAAEALWRSEVRHRGPHRATFLLVAGKDAFAGFGPTSATVPDLRRHALMLARSEAVAHAAGLRSDIYASPAGSVVDAAILCADVVRRREAARIAADTHADVDYLKGLGTAWSEAREKLETALSQCRTQLAGVLRDPQAVMWRLVTAPEQEQDRMLQTLRATPALAERELGSGAALVESGGWWRFGRASRTAPAVRNAPMAAAWLQHLASCTRNEDALRRELAGVLGRGPKNADEFQAELATLIASLERRAAEAGALRRGLDHARAPLDLGVMPPDLRREVHRIAGRTAMDAAASAGPRAPGIGSAGLER